MSSEKPDQIQASVAAALSRLRGDLGPTGATAPKIDEPPMGGSGDRPRPANDVRGDPFFRSIQTPPPGTGMAGRGAIPMTPFPRMQAPQEPPAQEPPLSDDPKDEETGLEPAATIDIPDMPERDETPEQVSMPEPPSMSEAAGLPQDEAVPQPTPEAQSAAAAAAAAANPLARMMRPGQPGAAAPVQRDLLADLPPPPISEPLRAADTESGASRRRRRNRRLLAAAAVVIVVVLGAWLWTKGEPSTEIPVITAEATPEKVKPAEEGGLQVQNQDVQVLDPSTQTQAETVMPEPEQPIMPPAATDAPAAEQAPTVVENGESNAAPTAEAPAADVAPSPDVPLAETPLPAMEENGTTEAAPAAPTAAAPEQTQTAETPAATEQAPATTAETTPAPAATPEPAPEAAAQPEPAQTTQSEQPAQAAQPEQPAVQEAPAQQAAITPVAPAGSTRVQLAAGKSEASVQKEWAALQKAHPDLLGPLSLHIERVDKGASGIFYRLQAGPLTDKNAAKELCASLKQKGQDCLVVAK
jgi:hypothetical protein